MTATTNRRRDTRIPIRLDGFYSAGQVGGVGLLANISYSGALIEDISTRPPEIGTPIVVCVYLISPHDFEEVTPLELTGHVVRHSLVDFAIEYEDNHDPDVRRMVDDAAAIVAAPR